MVVTHSDQKLQEILQRLVSSFHPKSIFLFGSRARGNDKPGSDYDILMVLEHASDPRYKRVQRIRPVLRGVGVSVDLIVLTQEEFDSEADIVCSLPATILREGKKLYAA